MTRVRAADLVGLGVVVAVTAFVWRSVLFAAHPIVSGDLFTPFTMEALRAQFVSFWNPVLEFPNVETIDRLAFVAPFLPLGDPALIQKAMIVVLVLGAGASMFLSARRLSAPLLLAVLAGIAFACNPWIAQRLQHLFILPGYVVLPAVIAMWLRPPRKAGVLWLVLLVTLGSATPHTTAALWFVLVVLLLVRPSGAALRRFAWTAGAYAAVNVWWWLPVFAYLGAADLVPSWPTWDLVELFSRDSEPAAVLRLDGYWWPLAEVHVEGWQRVAGLGLAAAAFIGLLVRRTRWTWALVGLAGMFGAFALGTNGAVGYGWFTVDGPLADRFGWVLRDPNKLVGALAGFLGLLAAGVGATRDRTEETADAPPSIWRGPMSLRLVASAQGVLVIGYLAFALPYTSTYVARTYVANPVPDGLRAAASWLGEQSGRSSWIPAYFGSQTFWNGDNFTHEVLSYGTPGPVLAPYNHDDRAQRAFLTLDLGAVLGDIPADPQRLMERFGVRWLAHHRDVLPRRLQKGGGWDARVELRAVRLGSSGLAEAERFPGATIYGTGATAEPRWVTPALAARPTATAAALSLWGPRVRDLIAVDRDHPGVERALLLPGDALVPVLAGESIRVPLAGAAPYARPHDRWSRFLEMELGWWSQLAERGGPPPSDAPGGVTTRASGSELHVATAASTGTYSVWWRVYRGAAAGRVRVMIDDQTWTIDLRTATSGMSWERLGVLDVDGPDVSVTLTNLHGDNAIADFLLIPSAEEQRALARTDDLQPTWLWTQIGACRAAEPDARFADQIDAATDLPLDRLLDIGRMWRDYASVELELFGHDDGRVVEVWAEADGVWVYLGEVEVYWEGWRTTNVPVEPERFVAAPNGARSPASRLRLLASAATKTSTAPSIAVRSVILRSHGDCTWTVDVPADGTYLLYTSAASRPFSLEVGATTIRVNPGRANAVRLGAGTQVLRFPEGIPPVVDGLWLQREPAQETEAASSAGCADTWRLLWTPDRYIERLGGVTDGERVEAVPVDGLLAGYWLPPGECGPVWPDNPWKRLGAASLAASLVSTAGLLALAAVGRVP